MHETQPHQRLRQPLAHTRRPPPSAITRGTRWRRRLILVGILLAGILVAGIALLWQRAAAFNEAVSTEPMLSTKLWGPLGGQERVSVLLLGHSPGGRDGAYLSDSITILSIDPTTDQTTSISIPRDLWVEGHPDLPLNGKVNEAFAVGFSEGGYPEAGERATRTVSDITGIELVGWISLDFEGFREMVDAVGGITLDNPRAFRWAAGPDEHARQEWVGSFSAGELSLDGLDALRYSRVRFTDTAEESSDFARSARQQLILSAVRDRVSLDPGGLPQALALTDALQGQLHTNLSAPDLALLAGHISPSSRIQLEEGVILEAGRNSVGQYVLLVIGRNGPTDYSPLHTHLSAQLETPREPS